MDTAEDDAMSSSSSSWVYWAVTVVIICTVAIVITICVLLSWLLIFYKHSKYRRLKKHKLDTSQVPTVATVNVDKLRHAHTYHEKSFKSGVDLDSLVYGVNPVTVPECTA